MLRSVLLLILALVPFSHTTTPRIDRVLFIGNSITFTQPMPGEPYFWLGSWGMNATAAHLDYAHQVWAGIAAHQGYIPEMKIVSVIFVDDLDIAEQILEYDPDMIIFQWGEADTYKLTQEEWDAAYALIGGAARSVGARILAVGLWGTHPIEGRDEKLRLAALAAGMTYIPFADLHATRTAEMCVGLHPGVCNHPDDGEMMAIAERILEAIYNQDTYLPFVSAPGGTVPRSSP